MLYTYWSCVAAAVCCRHCCCHWSCHCCSHCCCHCCCCVCRLATGWLAGADSANETSWPRGWMGSWRGGRRSRSLWKKINRRTAAANKEVHVSYSFFSWPASTLYCASNRLSYQFVLWHLHPFMAAILTSCLWASNCDHVMSVHY